MNKSPSALSVSSSGSSREERVNAWSAAFSQRVLNWARPPAVDNQEVLADVYHSLIHSQSLSETLLRLEHAHAEAMEQKARSLNWPKTAIDPAASEASGTPQWTRLQNESDWAHAHETQRREFRDWLMTVHDEFQSEERERAVSQALSLAADAAGSGSSSGNAGRSNGVSRSDSAFALQACAVASPHVRQESFTITLGAQMKHMHNLRLIASDPLDLCRYPAQTDDALPRRLQTSMSLYSHNLSGLVLLGSDDPLARPTELTREFMDLVQRSTESHFPTFERQIQAIQEDHVGPALAWRRARPGTRISPEPSESPNESKIDTGLMTGDFYVTKHSNLCGVHVLFHLISDESVLNGNINSRHPVVLGLRNVLKTASLSDVTTVTLPLLLTHSMSETMTVQWCLKRAELIFKCVKGFMMEVASWGGSELKTLQFLVPQDIDPEVFHRLTSMLASIFRTSNPISF